MKSGRSSYIKVWAEPVNVCHDGVPSFRYSEQAKHGSACIRLLLDLDLLENHRRSAVSFVLITRAYSMIPAEGPVIVSLVSAKNLKFRCDLNPVTPSLFDLIERTSTGVLLGLKLLKNC